MSPSTTPPRFIADSETRFEPGGCAPPILSPAAPDPAKDALHYGFVYLASPFTAPASLEPPARDALEVSRAGLAAEVAATLMRQGFTVFSPIAHSFAIERRLNARQSHDFWMKQDLPILSRAASLFVLLLDGWSASKGVREEIRFARKRGIPVSFCTEDGRFLEYSEGAHLALSFADKVPA